MDPIVGIGRWLRDAPLPGHRDRGEQLDYRDRAALAAALIRDHELRLWFEPNNAIAERIQALCPMCAVYTVGIGAAMTDELDRPPPWRRNDARRRR